MRGDLYQLKAPRDALGHEQAGVRYAVVVQSDDLPLSTWVIAPTSTGRRDAWFRPEIQINSVKIACYSRDLCFINQVERRRRVADHPARDRVRVHDAGTDHRGRQVRQAHP